MVVVIRFLKKTKSGVLRNYQWRNGVGSVRGFVWLYAALLLDFLVLDRRNLVNQGEGTMEVKQCELGHDDKWTSIRFDDVDYDNEILYVTFRRNPKLHTGSFILAIKPVVKVDTAGIERGRILIVEKAEGRNIEESIDLGARNWLI